MLPSGPPVHYDCDVCHCSPCACESTQAAPAEARTIIAQTLAYPYSVRPAHELQADQVLAALASHNLTVQADSGAEDSWLIEQAKDCARVFASWPQWKQDAYKAEIERLKVKP